MQIDYLDASQDDVRSLNAPLLEQIERQGLLFPVTVVDGVALYDGAVSYPAIMRAVQGTLEKIEA